MYRKPGFPGNPDRCRCYPAESERQDPSQVRIKLRRYRLVCLQPKKSPGSYRAGAGEKAAFDQNSNARLKRADRMPARNPGSRVAVGELMLKVGWLGEYPQLA